MFNSVIGKYNIPFFNCRNLEVYVYIEYPYTRMFLQRTKVANYSISTLISIRSCLSCNHNFKNFERLCF